MSTRAKNYKGFGEIHGLREWARLLEVNKDTLRYWLTTKGETVEGFAEKNGIQYRPKIDEGRTRTNRLAQAEELLRQLFERSGYDPDLMFLELTAGKRVGEVFYEGERVGVYNLDTGSLLFSDGTSGVGLLKYSVPDPQIERGVSGWDVAGETKGRIVDQLLARAPKDMIYPA